MKTSSKPPTFGGQSSSFSPAPQKKAAPAKAKRHVPREDSLNRSLNLDDVFFDAKDKLHPDQAGDESNRTERTEPDSWNQISSLKLGSMTLGEPELVEDVVPPPKITTPSCSACGNTDSLELCDGCKCVWYCDKDCKTHHRREHKKECKRIKKELEKRGGKLDLGTEKDMEPPLDLPPPRDKCLLCTQALPIHTMLQTYSVCCGKIICGGCDLQLQWESQKRSTAERGGQETPPAAPACAFCKRAHPESDDDKLTLLSRRVECRDPEALCSMAMVHGYGQLGLPVDQTKCIDLLREAADLGSPGAQHQLGVFYLNGEMGLAQNEEEALKHWEQAAESGHVQAQHSLGCMKAEQSYCRNTSLSIRCTNHVAAMRHFRMAASAGYRISMESLIARFELGFLHHSDLAETLQEMYRSRSELKSEGRDQYIKYLKLAGEYKAEYDV